ncbi:MAG: phosphate acyltransferase PlsX [Lachnospiraceae bacterium]|nr:phosphate acyltransferase PlsX [Lachnospiraceae bacterium]
MSEIKVVIDAMGGDNAPVQPVKGAVEALERESGFSVILTGDESVIKAELAKYTYDADRVTIVHADEVIETGEHPVAAIRKKRNSSLVVGERMLRNGEASGFISAGSTGAVLAGGQLIVGRLPGVERAPLAVLIPTLKGVSLLVDCGANVDARSSHLVQFARMGTIYMKNIIGVAESTVGLVNIGVEEEKGNALCKETFPLLKACEDIRFIGNVESREIPNGAADILVCEGFTGNIILKLYEGTASALTKMIKQGMMSTLRSKIGGLLVKPALKETLKSLDASEYGGAPMLGLSGLVMKTHGNSTSKEVANSVIQCVNFARLDLTEKIKEALAQKPEQGGENGI